MDLPLCSFRYDQSIIYDSSQNKQIAFERVWDAYVTSLPKSLSCHEVTFIKHHTLTWITEMLLHASITVPDENEKYFEYIHMNRFPHFTVNLVLTVCH